MSSHFAFDPGKIYAYHKSVVEDKNNRYKSWEHCYKIFENFEHDQDFLSLHLAFYLASWGMYRGSSFLLQKDYKIHNGAINILKEYLYLRNINGDHSEYIPNIIELSERLKQYYIKYSKSSKSPSDTLISKILLGSLGCTPAFDRYFVLGVKSRNLNFTKMTVKNYQNLFSFCQKFSQDLIEVQETIQQETNIYYPIFKLIDMYFWQEGALLEVSR